MLQTDAKRQWLPFDHVSQRSGDTLVPPPLAVEIVRASHSWDRSVLAPFENEREWLARWREENDSRLEAEREARFQAHLKSLNLDNTTGIPCTIVHHDGKKESSSYLK